MCLLTRPGECLVPQSPPEPMPPWVPRDAGLLGGLRRAGDAAGAMQLIRLKAETCLSKASFYLLQINLISAASSDYLL